MKIKVRWWLESDQGIVLGRGRRVLLEAIDRCGSLRQAARQCGISYRAAWGKIRASEAHLGQELVSTHRGRRGMTLTPAGRRLLRLFRKLEKEMDAAVAAIEKKWLSASPSGGDEGE